MQADDISPEVAAPQQFWRLYFDRRSSIGLGSALIMLGAVSVVFGVQGIMTYAALQYIGCPIWCGAMFIVTGSVATAAGSKVPTRCLVTALVSVSSVCLLFALIEMVIGAVGAYLNYTSTECAPSVCNSSHYCTYWLHQICLDHATLERARVAGVGSSACGLLAFCLAIAAASLGCGCFMNPQSVHPADEAGSGGRQGNPSPHPRLPPIIIQVPPLMAGATYSNLHLTEANGATRSDLGLPNNKVSSASSPSDLPPVTSNQMASHDSRHGLPPYTLPTILSDSLPKRPVSVRASQPIRRSSITHLTYERGVQDVPWGIT